MSENLRDGNVESFDEKLEKLGRGTERPVGGHKRLHKLNSNKNSGGWKLFYQQQMEQTSVSVYCG